MTDPVPASAAGQRRTGNQRPTRRHYYEATVSWTGNRGQGTAGYTAYGRDHVIRAGDAPPLSGSSDPAFRGEADRYNPEQLLVASLSACHMLWYLHLCSTAGIVVTAYEDSPEGTMIEDADGSGRFTEVTLHPRVSLADDGDRARAEALHQEAHRMCFIANSVAFPVQCRPA